MRAANCNGGAALAFGLVAGACGVTPPATFNVPSLRRISQIVAPLMLRSCKPKRRLPPGKASRNE
jgi:hypothetical protein